ncbi:hypothetical protein EYC80_001938 [Monilinia laxa]|uniref:Uncharacterized protein n=1 Tax=Monilinia laxa TaxID=61186 RepID=A0A5N6K6I6_MONLA|nr:hypothetical protein EYC80_001938 [Monilinia laxa]
MKLVIVHTADVHHTYVRIVSFSMALSSGLEMALKMDGVEYDYKHGMACVHHGYLLLSPLYIVLFRIFLGDMMTFNPDRMDEGK